MDRHIPEPLFTGTLAERLEAILNLDEDKKSHELTQWIAKVLPFKAILFPDPYFSLV